jgi:hypothetical protein
MATDLGGRILILQFKASNHIMKNGRRRFHASHVQMQNLRDLAGPRRRAVFYALPNVGTTHELGRNPCLLWQTWFLDVGAIPNPVPAPTRGASKAVRVSGNHYIDLDASAATATICSEPFTVSAKEGEEWIDSVFQRPFDEVGLEPKEARDLAGKMSFGQGTLAGIVHREVRHP